MSFVFGICLVLIGLTYAEVRITNHKELMDEGFNGFLTCVSQLGLSIETCGDLLDDKFNSNDTKYDGCKCLLPCIAKIIGTMNVSDGKWNEKRYWEITALVEVPEWKQEAEIIGKNCGDSVNTHCSAGFPLFQCALKHSKMLQNISKNFMLQKQADIEAMNATNFEYENDDQNNQTTH
ncbi:uncharacterized protein LOC132932413 [Rhopalosiphum padi]|uniref:uncharacterized protein LOC132932413 n=1 Tax=Rhopalosiphum padi TaxID=40932 RepID=UPI00298D8028|nr:uncharacterized protein LOC132932413 [Rhopalosiphum padi]